MTDHLTPEIVLDFWFSAGEEKWFKQSDDFDAEITAKFADHHEAAKQGRYDAWQDTANGTLALIILLDQFARNIHRGKAEAFAADPKALAIAKHAVAQGTDMELPAGNRKWIYLPYEHSEDMADQTEALELFKKTGSDDDVEWAKLHADIIERFGRFPHRNAILGRNSTPEEEQFLKEGGFSG